MNNVFKSDGKLNLNKILHAFTIFVGALIVIIATLKGSDSLVTIFIAFIAAGTGTTRVAEGIMAAKRKSIEVSGK